MTNETETLTEILASVEMETSEWAITCIKEYDEVWTLLTKKPTLKILSQVLVQNEIGEITEVISLKEGDYFVQIQRY